MIYRSENRKGLKILSNFFLFCLLLNFSFFAYSFSKTNPDTLKSTAPVEKNTETIIKNEKTEIQINDAQDAIWRISDSIGGAYSTAFAIAPRLFVMTLHGLKPILKNENSIQDIFLYKNKRSSQLKIKQIIAVSALYDLALLETEENVTTYLNINENPIQANEDLIVIGYPDFVFKKMKKTGKLVDQDFFYGFTVDYSNIFGASGSPVVNQKNQVEGIVTLASYNMLYAIKPKYLKRVISGDEGLNCSDFTHPVICLKKTIENLKNLANQGNAFAQLQLANYYAKDNLKSAFNWTKKAAEQDFALAEFQLARMYLRGKGTEKNLKLAFEWMEKAVAGDDIKAQYNLGEMYLNGEGTEKNLKLAFEWIKASAEQGYTPAQYALALMYFWGDGTEKNLKLAFEWMEKAAEHGDASAQHMLASMYYIGEGAEKNLEQAFIWYEKSANQGHPESQQLLESLYQNDIFIPNPYTSNK